MLRLSKGLIVAGFLVLFFGAVSLGFLFILSGGDVVGYVRTTYLRIVLNSRQEDLDRSVSNDATDISITIETGDTPTIIANKLYANNLLVDEELFLNYVIAEGLDRRLEAATYLIDQTQTIPEIASMLTDAANNGVIYFRVIAGTRLEEIAESIDNHPRRFEFSGADFLALADIGNNLDSTLAAELGIPAGATLEGFMYPSTYALPPDVTALALRDTILAGFRAAFSNEMIEAALEQSLSVRDVVTLASIIERESVHPDENTMIASVYRNRLTEAMTLDADPTIQYALDGSRGTWWPNISPADYRGVDSPYNAYNNFGLPPSPIANPSLSAIMAAIYPDDTDYLFFRASCDGSGYHVFSETYDEHLANGC